MKIRFLKDWRGFRARRVVDGYPAGAGRLLISRGIAELAELRVSYETLTVRRLRLACEERGLPQYGKKQALIDRLDADDLAKEAGRAG